MCNSCSRRATCASSARTFASSGLRSAGFAPRFFAANSRSEPLRRRLAPSRQMRAVQPLAAKQAAHLAGLRAAVGLLWDSQSILGGELAPLRLGYHLGVRRRPRAARSGSGGLVAPLLNPQSPSAHLVQCHRFSLCDHRFSSPPPHSNSKGCRCLIDVGREGQASRDTRIVRAVEGDIDAQAGAGGRFVVDADDPDGGSVGGGDASELGEGRPLPFTQCHDRIRPRRPEPRRHRQRPSAHRSWACLTGCRRHT